MYLKITNEEELDFLCPDEDGHVFLRISRIAWMLRRASSRVEVANSFLFFFFSITLYSYPLAKSSILELDCKTMKKKERKKERKEEKSLQSRKTEKKRKEKKKKGSSRLSPIFPFLSRVVALRFPAQDGRGSFFYSFSLSIHTYVYIHKYIYI